MSVSSAQALLLVDGYNIIGAWEKLQKIRDRDGLEFARRDLISLVIDYTAYQGFKTEIVFDSHFQKTPNQKEEYSPTVSVHYTAFAQTADTYIERVCAAFSRSHQSVARRLIVATSDRAQRLTAIGYGAECFSAEKFQKEIESSASQIRRKNSRQSQTRGRFLVNHLDPKTQAALFEWRQGKPSQ
ncbi:NYN domain-containing protein [Gloeocapsa sp. PCC 73106]|uniref:NYN domain-containing protein n=1 Tax=Gloeocapsa sp. PCC 73106 TaxID=102232 RepID=UPI0002AC0720|nr:NYN domain-containing protein [Gloeocapsa sp. PCC 73106]ELR99060.1 putative RNA-binding protein containing a PIN domain [Gloeocapsa sp. PCC 73106]